MIPNSPKPPSLRTKVATELQNLKQKYLIPSWKHGQYLDLTDQKIGGIYSPSMPAITNIFIRSEERNRDIGPQILEASEYLAKTTAAGIVMRALRGTDINSFNPYDVLDKFRYDFTPVNTDEFLARALPFDKYDEITKEELESLY
jgi:hypothetical protein